MIYFYYGTDREKIQKTARATFEALQKKKPDASFMSFDAPNIDENVLQEITASQGLFERKIVARISDVFEDKEKSELILGYLKQMKESENIIVWSEGDLNKAPLEKIKKHAEKVEQFDVTEKKVKQAPTIFALSDALASRDRKTLWQLLVRELRSGTAAEEIHGTLFWQIKSLILAHKTRTAEEAGLNAYVYSKAKQSTKNWSEHDLKRASRELVMMYHESHRGQCDFAISLEKWVLGI